MNNDNKDLEQRAKVADAVIKWNNNPTPENLSKFAIELAKLDVVWSNNSEEEKETAKDWADLSFELFVSKDYIKAKAILLKLLSDIESLMAKDLKD